jgi:molybdopterin molybdotransferase
MPSASLITPDHAAQIIISRIDLQPVEVLPLAQCVGRTLREPIHAERDQPPFDRVTMDGIALDSRMIDRGQTRFPIQATQAAGAAAMTLVAQTQAIEVMTGAALPSGCNCVIPVEQIEIADGVATLRGSLAVAPYDHVHRRGSDAVSGASLLDAGTVLRAPEIAIAATAGHSQLAVSRQPVITVLSTGDELVDPGDPIAPFQVRRSNTYAVSADLRRRGFLHVLDDHVADSPTALRQTLTRYLATSDFLLLSGGFSMGKFDLVPQSLAELGVEPVLHKIAQRPGKPMWFGIGPRGQAVFGLPGNPVSTLVCLLRYVVPALARAMGSRPAQRERIGLGSPFAPLPSMTLFLAVAIADDESGRPCAMPMPTNGSGDLLTLTSTHGFIELPTGGSILPRGFVAELYRWW